MKTLCPFTVVLIAAFLINHGNYVDLTRSRYQFIIFICLHAVFARKCWVGSGSNNISLPLTADSEKEKAGSEEKKTSERKTGPFKMMKCGDSGSQLVNFDSFIDDAKKKIADAVGSAKSALGIDSGKRRRRKRAADDGDKWACAKVMLPGKTHRSCVKKAVDLQVRMYSTSAVTNGLRSFFSPPRSIARLRWGSTLSATATAPTCATPQSSSADQTSTPCSALLPRSARRSGRHEVNKIRDS